MSCCRGVCVTDTALSTWEYCQCGTCAIEYNAAAEILPLAFSIWTCKTLQRMILSVVNGSTVQRQSMKEDERQSMNRNLHTIRVDNLSTQKQMRKNVKMNETKRCSGREQRPSITHKPPAETPFQPIEQQQDLFKGGSWRNAQVKLMISNKFAGNYDQPRACVNEYQKLARNFRHVDICRHLQIQHSSYFLVLNVPPFA